MSAFWFEAPSRRVIGREIREYYAAYLAYADHETGRVIQEIEKLSQLDNTLTIYIAGPDPELCAATRSTDVGVPHSPSQADAST